MNLTMLMMTLMLSAPGDAGAATAPSEAPAAEAVTNMPTTPTAENPAPETAPEPGSAGDSAVSSPTIPEAVPAVEHGASAEAPAAKASYWRVMGSGGPARFAGENAAWLGDVAPRIQLAAQRRFVLGLGDTWLLVGMRGNTDGYISLQHGEAFIGGLLEYRPLGGFWRRLAPYIMVQAMLGRVVTADGNLVARAWVPGVGLHGGVRMNVFNEGRGVFFFVDGGYNLRATAQLILRSRRNNDAEEPIDTTAIRLGQAAMSSLDAQFGVGVQF